MYLTGLNFCFVFKLRKQVEAFIKICVIINSYTIMS